MSEAFDRVNPNEPDTGAGHSSRLTMALIGAAGGLSFWLLAEAVFDDILQSPLSLFITALTFAFFGATLAMSGPLAPGRAAVQAIPVAVVSSLLMLWAALRFDAPSGFLDQAHGGIAYAVLITISLPFVIARAKSRDGIWDYPALFHHAWAIIVRYFVAHVFVGLFWGLVFLSHALLSIVGIDVIEELIDVDPVPWILTGGMLGLALAVVNELADYISARLIFLLLRLLLPGFAVVVTLFAIALPFQGLGKLFGGLSDAAVLMAITYAGVTLITVACGMRNGDAVQGPMMRKSTILLVLVLPVIAALAIYALWLRVNQYGWTPERLLASVLAAFAMAYSVAYAGSVVMRGQWMARIRKVNIVLALATIIVAALWQTPLLNAERIAARSQIARFEAGATEVADLDLWELGRAWGKPGQTALATLMEDTQHPDHAALAERMAFLEEATSRYGFQNSDRQERVSSKAEDLRAILTVLPEGQVIPENALAVLSPRELEDIAEGCGRMTPGGAPGCLAMPVVLHPRSPAPEVIVFWIAANGATRFQALRASPNQQANTGTVNYQRVYQALSEYGEAVRFDTNDVIDRLHAGAYSVGPADLNVLRLEDTSIFINP